jgi:hypothetical protein
VTALERTQLTSTGAAFSPALSPDGTRLAMAERTCDPDGQCSIDLRVQDVGGAGAATLLRGLVGIGAIEWNGDGRWLLLNASLQERWGVGAAGARWPTPLPRLLLRYAVGER